MQKEFNPANHSNTEAVAQRCSLKEVLLEISQRPANFWKADTGTGVFCKFRKISKSNFFYRTLLLAAFASSGNAEYETLFLNILSLQ